MEKYLENLEYLFRENINPENALSMKKYMKNRFEYLGIKRTKLRELSKPFLKKENLLDLNELEKTVKTLWNFSEREFQYFALDLIEKYYKTLPENYIELYESLILNKSWWDTVDIIAPKFVGNHFKRFPEIKNKKIEKWLKSKNIWLIRSCIIFQLKYKIDTDKVLLHKIINDNVNSNEFFINKAIGWILREYSKTNPDFVIKFVKNVSLSNLSKREALKWLNKQKSKKNREKPLLIKGDVAVDGRGKVCFVNDFDFNDVKRFYISQNHKENFVRAWQCHKHEAKYFTVVQGTALICAVKIDNWQNPAKDLPVEKFILSDENPMILKIPSGYANGIMNFSKDTKIMIFATTTILETSKDDIRLDPFYWNPWE